MHSRGLKPYGTGISSVLPALGDLQGTNGMYAIQTKGWLELVFWTSVITACSQNGKDMEDLDLFRDMLHPHLICPLE
ncbi:hypothetical protein RHSIM_Rhsim02G0012200 [Rhododendron simsii]|uniref:Uncharacterized protein n=1 Tax=Rhododendron simsii TaxID=118357 RepID=A0A834LWB7_RHOSS|nr:hypothetical protein RHSIM_Rhsim02G0012200 [Rhododendron simsii]